MKYVYSVLRLALLIVICVGAQGAANNVPIAEEAIQQSSEVFIKQGKIRRVARYAWNGLIIAGASYVMFGKVFPAISKEEQLRVHAECLRLEEQYKKNLPSEPIAKACLRAVGTLGFGMLWFLWSNVQANVLSGVVQGFISPVVGPVQNLLNTERTLAVDDFWFLQKQTNVSRTSFVIVSTDLSDFLQELRLLDHELHTILANLYKLPCAVKTQEMIDQMRQRIALRITRILGHMHYMQQHVAADDVAMMHEVSAFITAQLQQALQNFNENLQLGDAPELTVDERAQRRHSAIVDFDSAIKQSLGALLTINAYHIHPAPLALGVMEFCQRFGLNMATSIGDPVPTPMSVPV